MPFFKLLGELCMEFKFWQKNFSGGEQNWFLLGKGETCCFSKNDSPSQQTFSSHVIPRGSVSANVPLGWCWKQGNWPQREAAVTLDFEHQGFSGCDVIWPGLALVTTALFWYCIGHPPCGIDIFQVLRWLQTLFVYSFNSQNERRLQQLRQAPIYVVLTMGPGMGLKALDILTHLILTTVLGGRNYQPRFTDDRAEVDSWNNLPKVTARPEAKLLSLCSWACRTSTGTGFEPGMGEKHQHCLRLPLSGAA